MSVTMLMPMYSNANSESRVRRNRAVNDLQLSVDGFAQQGAVYGDDMPLPGQHNGEARRRFLHILDFNLGEIGTNAPVVVGNYFPLPT